MNLTKNLLELYWDCCLTADSGQMEVQLLQSIVIKILNVINCTLLSQNFFQVQM